ncbi:MAG: amino acid adenylation domain-containing protein [Ignavibacterium sp.]|jgi:amino acid adenylation domain-containing protein|nr:amino acid adenylation domain-containing protein [Ignavibacterium sp.]
METNSLNNFITAVKRISETSPNKPAIRFEKIELSYSMLYIEIEKLSSVLIQKGLKRADRVGINLPRSLETIISILSVLRIGAVYIPLDPLYPSERINYIIKDANLKAILSKSDVVNENLETQIIFLDNINLQPLSIKDIEILPEDTAYIIYTSGSTGRPKGVEITHFNLTEFTRLASMSLGTSENDICLGTASINYALSVRQIFVPLSQGAKLIFVSDEVLKDPEKLLKLIKEEKITQADFVPSHLRTLINYLLSLPSESRGRLLENNLKRIIIVGEALSADLTEYWYGDLNQKCPIINIFGQTETTGIITYNQINPEEKLKGVVPIGKPIPETNIYILDEDLKPVEDGFEGELCVSNNCIARGYFNNPELTKKKFIKNHLDPGFNKIIYRTGDLVVRNKGIINYIGRKDNQIKIRGMRVEIGEIEYAINKMKFIEQSVVIPIKQENEIKLYAYIVVMPDFEFDLRALKQHLKSTLPSHMIPAYFNTVSSFPLTPNGKIDKLKLFEITSANTENKENESELSTVEKKLLTIWQKLIKNSNIDIYDDFFSIGGDSLLAVNLFILIEKEFNITLPISALYEAPTISKMSELLTNSLNKEIKFKSIVPIKPTGDKSPLFFVHGAGGNVLLYKDLVKYLDENRPFYGLQSAGLNGKDEILQTIEEMAAYYVNEIKIIQPDGPYFVGGYCMGGTIAIEIAQQLKREDKEVRAVFLLETYNWCALPTRNSFDRVYYNYQKIIFHFNNLMLLKLKEKKLFFGNKWNELKNRKNIWLDEISSFLKVNPNSSNNLNRIYSEIWEKNDKAAFKYESGVYDGSVYQFLPVKRYKIHSNQYADWKDLFPNLELKRLPVYAAGMLVEPFVKILANEINKILSQKNTLS